MVHPYWSVWELSAACLL